MQAGACDFEVFEARRRDADKAIADNFKELVRCISDLAAVIGGKKRAKRNRSLWRGDEDCPIVKFLAVWHEESAELCYGKKERLIRSEPGKPPHVYTAADLLDAFREWCHRTGLIKRPAMRRLSIGEMSFGRSITKHLNDDALHKKVSHAGARYFMT
jgi:hypothetical protein